MKAYTLWTHKWRAVNSIYDSDRAPHVTAARSLYSPSRKCLRCMLGLYFQGTHWLIRWVCSPGSQVRTNDQPSCSSSQPYSTGALCALSTRTSWVVDGKALRIHLKKEKTSTCFGGYTISETNHQSHKEWEGKQGCIKNGTI